MQTVGLATRSATRSGFLGGNAYPRVVSPPSGLGWSPSWSVVQTGPATFTTSLDPRDLKLSTANTRYVDIATGSDANTGLVAGSPKKSIWSAINVGGNDTIYVKGSADPNNPTVYHYDWSWRVVPVQNTNVIVVSDFTTLAPGWAVSSIGHKAGDSLLGTWALTADVTGPHVYEATLATSPGGGVIDASATPQASGAMATLTNRASIALVEANPGSWYHDGTKLYVRTATAAASGLSWSLTGGGTPLVYQTALTTEPFQVTDGGVPLTSRASAALVNANAGSYYWAANVLYVRLSDDRAPDSSVLAMISRAPDAALRPLKQAINGWLNTAISIYVERLIFEGGNARCFYLQHCATASFVDCTFRNGQQQGCELNVGAGVTGTTHNVNLIRCKALGNAGDGLGATVLGATETVKWLEWDCEATGNSGGGTEQGSSLHFTAGNTAVLGIRVGGNYHGNKTQEIADVGGCKVWQAGSRMASGGVVGYYCGDAGTSWLHGCVLTGNSTDLQTDNASGAINVSGTIYATTSGAGTVATYVP